MIIDYIISKYGFSQIPWNEMRSCACPNCEHKGLHYGNHPSAMGRKDYSRIVCRYCNKTVRRNDYSSNKVSKSHWVIIDFCDVSCLVTLDEKEVSPQKFYWGGGCTWCTFNDDTSIVKDHGWIDDTNESEINRIRLDFLKNYNKIEPSEPYQSAGWIDPDGKFYACNNCEHDSFAKQLAAVYYDSLDGVRCLESKEWIRVYDCGLLGRINYNYPVTQKQFDTLFAISISKALNDEYDRRIKDSIKRIEIK